MDGLGSSWTEEQKLTASDGAAWDWFGCSVSIDGDYAIVGADRDDDNGLNSGSAYIFKRDGTSWTEEQKLTAYDGVALDSFGYSVSIDDDYAIIGAYWVDTGEYAAGSAYIFKNIDSVWIEEQKLTASDGAAWDWFGWSVSIDENYAIIGTHVFGEGPGSAYIFKRDGTSWTEEQKLTASDGENGDDFGFSVSIDQGYAIIGAYGDDFFTGSAYVFKNPAPDLYCSGSLHWDDVEPSSTVSGSFTVENVGDSGTELSWEIDSFPDWGTWTFDPESGIGLLPGSPVTVDIDVVAPDDPETEFTGEIVVVNTEKPDDYCIIDVSLITPVSQQSLFLRFLERFPNAFPILRHLLRL